MDQTVDGISSDVYKAIVEVVDDRMHDIKVTLSTLLQEAESHLVPQEDWRLSDSQMGD